jgi:hypothetical protein
MISGQRLQRVDEELAGNVFSYNIDLLMRQGP